MDEIVVTTEFWDYAALIEKKVESQTPDLTRQKGNNNVRFKVEQGSKNFSPPRIENSISGH